MKKVISCIVIFFFNLSAAAIDYNDFPPNIQQILNERIAELASSGGICIAGRVTMDDEAHISNGADVQVNLYLRDRGDEPLWIYNDGWFIMGCTVQSGSHTEPARLILRAFGYDPIDASTAILKGKMTYVEFVMHKTPSEKLATITGTVVNEQNEPFSGASVGLSFPFSNHGVKEVPYVSIVTGPDGQYSFKGLSGAEHSVVASASGYAYHHIGVTPPAGETIIRNLMLYRNRKAVIDYVYQGDGSRNFTGGKLETGTIEWVNGTGGIDFSDGRVKQYEPNSLGDIEMTQDSDTLGFRIFYSNGKNGFYDAGAVNFESVTEAAEAGYSTGAKPCIVGHVYIVRTHDEDNYAKFIVKSISVNE
jgi:hypothetical protein